MPHTKLIYRLLYAFILGILLIGCEQTTEHCNGVTLKASLEHLEINLVPTNIQVPDTISSQHIIFDVDRKNNEFIYCGYNRKQHRIETYTGGQWTISESFHHSIKGNISAISVRSLDSIFLVTEQPQHLYLLNALGELNQMWDVSEPFSSVTDDYFYMADGNNNKPLISPDGTKALFNLTRLDMETENFEKEGGFIAAFNLKSSQWLRKPFGKVPKLYTKGEYPRDFTIPDVIWGNEFIVTAFPLSNKIDFYDSKTFNFLSSICLNSNRTPLNYKVSKHPDLEDEDNYLITQPFFSGIYYEQRTNSIIRMYFKEQTLNQVNGELNTLANRKMAIMRLSLSDSLVLIQDYKTENPMSFISKYGSSSEGVHYFNTNITDNDNFLSLVQFKLDE